ncbi:hypothetical protein IE077_002736, partial [Cardiosporidium cionae]
ADARNSIFKLSQRYQLIPDNEKMIKIKQILGKVSGEEEESGDEDWEPSYKRLPTILRERISKTLSNTQDDTMQEHMLEEMNLIEKESANMVQSGIVTLDTISLAPNNANVEESDKEEHEEEELIGNPEVLKEMQLQFMKSNLKDWFEDIKQAYTNGIKLIKINALGQKFIRIVHIVGTQLRVSRTSVSTSTRIKTDREVETAEIEEVILGKGSPSKEFAALIALAKTQSDMNDPSPTLCAVVTLPKERTLSLVFLEEERRNAFVFYLRIIARTNREMRE